MSKYLTDEEIQTITDTAFAKKDANLNWPRIFADAAADHALANLKCGPNPCPACELRDECIEASQPGWCQEPPYHRWLGQAEMAREIVGYLGTFQSIEGQWATKLIQEYLKEKGL